MTLLLSRNRPRRLSPPELEVLGVSLSWEKALRDIAVTLERRKARRALWLSVGKVSGCLLWSGSILLMNTPQRADLALCMAVLGLGAAFWYALGEVKK